jgi:restriction system protein
MIPDYESLMLPVLKACAEKPVRVRDVVEMLATELQVTPEDRAILIPSGKTRLFNNRVHWAATYLVKAGVLTRPERGVLSITERGKTVLREAPSEIDVKYLRRFPELQAFLEGSNVSAIAHMGPEITPVSSVGLTPEERIDAAQKEIEQALSTDLIERIGQLPPEFFERLIIDLMLAMKYGLSGSASHLGRSNDGGVDGVISEDPLGLDLVFLQAKRYAPGNVVGVEKIHAFAGSLAGRGATKGVFVTTSHFSPQAKEFATRTHQRLVLIDGEELARLLVHYGVGVRTERSLEIKRIDIDYFDTDDSSVD